VIKEFLERNKPVFTIGIITFVIFIFIIFIGLIRQNKEPNLVKLGNESTYTLSEDGKTTPDLEIEQTQDGTITEGSQPEEEIVPLSFDERLGIIEVKYYEKWGFVPKNSKALNGQLVKSTNTTDRDIYIVQKMPTYSELEDPFLIKPDETFEFRLYEIGMWTYEELETKHFGSINVKPNLIP